MGLSSKSERERESHVLKLVHPGGFVELHSNPVMASEIMNKNPRHYVTRPDIFRFPWIVVSPESILRPGNVFFIVPCHTIRHLMKNSTNHPHRFLPTHPNESSVDQDSIRGRKTSISNNVYCFRKQSPASPSMPSMKLRTPREGQKQRKGGNMAPFCLRERSSYSSEHASRHARKERARSSRGLSHSEQLPKLKSCLKKDNKSHHPPSRNLKVRFACNDEDLDNKNP